MFFLLGDTQDTRALTFGIFRFKKCMLVFLLEDTQASRCMRIGCGNIGIFKYIEWQEFPCFLYWGTL